MLARGSYLGAGFRRQIKRHQDALSGLILWHGMQQRSFGPPSRPIHTSLRGDWDELSKDPKYLVLAEKLTKVTSVPLKGTTGREALEDPQEIPHDKTQHLASIKPFLGETYGIKCQVDEMANDALCGEHVALMRVVIAIIRDMDPESYGMHLAIARELGNVIEEIDDTTLYAIVDVGGNVNETRSQDFLKDLPELRKILKDPDKVPGNVLSRALEMICTPLGAIAHNYGNEKLCKIKQAKKDGKNIGQLEEFMDGLMPSLQGYKIPYLKAPGSPEDTVKVTKHKVGDKLNPNEVAVMFYFLQNCGCPSGKKATIPDFWRAVLLDSDFRRTLQAITQYNLPPTYGPSGSTGFLMQAAIGLLIKSGYIKRNDLTAEQIMKLGLTLAGCNYFKGGYHSPYDVYIALNWVIAILLKQNYNNETIESMIKNCHEGLKKCMDPADEKYPLVCKTLDMVCDHFLLHFELYKQNTQILLKEFELGLLDLEEEQEEQEEHDEQEQLLLFGDNIPKPSRIPEKSKKEEEEEEQTQKTGESP